MDRRRIVSLLLVALVGAPMGCIIETRDRDHRDHRDDGPPPPPPSDPAPPPPSDPGPPPPPPDQGPPPEGNGADAMGHHHRPNHEQLPNKGLLENYLPPNWKGTTTLPEGRYFLRNDHIHFVNGGLQIYGAGIGKTVILGDVEVDGNGYVFNQITITGNLKYRGNYSSGLFRVEGDHDIKGMGNKDTFSPH